MRRAALSLWLAAFAAPAAAQGIAVSPAPDSVAVTVYRDPERGPDERPRLEWLGGYSLITEKRTVDIPAGDSILRFEGVAGGIIPQSAIVTGLPDGLVEKNQDAWLLSPASLLDSSLGKRVHLRRTSLATGAVTETEAVIRSSADGAVVVETPSGIETLRCTGLPETLVYGEVPPGLSARPTLSVRTRSRAPVRATLTLSYLATGFDWQADYIAELSPDGRTAELFVWLTLANGDETGFRDADTQAVAGRLNREEAERIEPRREPLRLECWPQGTTTSDLQPLVPPPPPAPPPPAAPEEAIVVTGSRVSQDVLNSFAPVTAITAEQEELGDLKLYRIPEPVTVAAKSQKQVALLRREGVKVRMVFRQSFAVGDAQREDQEPPQLFLLARNRDSDGLGLPLPSGAVSLFARANGRNLLLAEGEVADHAVGEEVEIEFGWGPQLATEFRFLCRRGGTGEYEIAVVNRGARPASFEGRLLFAKVRSKARLGKKDSDPLWTVTVAPGETSRLRFESPVDLNRSMGEPVEGGCSRQARRR